MNVKGFDPAPELWIYIVFAIALLVFTLIIAFGSTSILEIRSREYAGKSRETFDSGATYTGLNGISTEIIDHANPR